MEPASPTATKYSNCLSVKRSTMGDYDARLGAAIKSWGQLPPRQPPFWSRVFSRVLRGGMVSKILAMGGNTVRQMFGVVPDAPDEAGSPSRLPRQSQEIDPGLDRNTALMLRPTPLVECGDLQPAIVGSKTCRPDDRSYSDLRQIQLENWIRHARRVRFDLAGC